MSCLQVGAEGPTTSTGCTLQVNNVVEAFAECKALTTGLRLLWSLSPDQQVSKGDVISKSGQYCSPCIAMYLYNAIPVCTKHYKPCITCHAM